MVPLRGFTNNDKNVRRADFRNYSLFIIHLRKKPEIYEK